MKATECIYKNVIYKVKTEYNKGYLVTITDKATLRQRVSDKLLTVIHDFNKPNTLKELVTLMAACEDVHFAQIISTHLIVEHISKLYSLDFETVKPAYTLFNLKKVPIIVHEGDIYYKVITLINLLGLKKYIAYQKILMQRIVANSFIYNKDQYVSKKGIFHIFETYPDRTQNVVAKIMIKQTEKAHYLLESKDKNLSLLKPFLEIKHHPLLDIYTGQ